MAITGDGEGHIKKCPLCNFNAIVKPYFENEYFKISRYNSQQVFMLSTKQHKMSLKLKELEYMHTIIKAVFGKNVFLKSSQWPNNHLHWLIYLTDTPDVNKIYSLSPSPIDRSGGYKASLREAAKHVTVPGDWAEFGVGGGNSTKLMLEILPEGKQLFMFDSFKGLPEDWVLDDGRVHRDYYKGKFDMEGVPPEHILNDERGEIYAGLFSDTVPKFRSNYGKKQLGLIHIDCDLYSSTKDVLGNIQDLIGVGTVIVFDEYYNYDVDGEGWRQHEYKAFQEFILNSSLDYEYLGRTLQWQVWLKIKEKETKW